MFPGGRKPAGLNASIMCVSRLLPRSRARSLRGGARCEERGVGPAQQIFFASMAIFKILQRVAPARQPHLEAQPTPAIEFLVPHGLKKQVGQGGTWLWVRSGMLQLG